jgi:Flp pilus assembly protein TadD
VKQIGGLQEVSQSGILNVTHENGKLEVGINSLAFVQAKLTIKSNDKILFSEDKSFKPMDVYTKTIVLADNEPYEVIVEGMDLKKFSENKNLIKRPFATTIPTNSSSASQWFQEGIELKENRNYKPAKVSLKMCLLKDPLFIDAMAALTELYYRSNQLDSALYYANQALQLDAYHPAANYFAGITYRALGDLINALETFGWAARSMEFRSAAWSQMAGIELQLNDLALAEHYANQALDFNRNNFNALNVLAVTYRLRGETIKADQVIATLLSIDPLNHFANFERFLLHNSSENLSLFKSDVRNEFPYQTFLELAIGYQNLGLTKDALQVLDNAPAHPLVTLWKAFLKDDSSMLDEIAKASPAFVFPYRTETVAALTWAAAINNNWKFKYYLGLNYWAINREDEAKKLFMACGNEPDYATFYLTRADLMKQIDKKQELMDLQSAQRLDPADWRTWNKLIEYYLNSEDNKTALSLSTETTTKFKGNFNLALQHARAQLNNGLFKECIKTLGNMKILPFEGSVQGKYVYEQSYLLLANDLMQKGKYKDALVSLEKSKEWPEHLGVGAPFEPDNRMQNYMEAICNNKLGRANVAKDLQNAVLDFTKTHYSAGRPNFNNIFALEILKQRGETEAANLLIQQIKESDQVTNPFQQWVVASFTGDTNKCLELEKEFDRNIYYTITKSIIKR